MVAWLSLAVAVAALVWAIHRDMKQREALDNERTEREAADARQLAARLVGEPQGGARGSAFEIEYVVRVRNLRAAPAEGAYVWLTERLPGDLSSGSITEQYPLGTVVSADGWLDVTLRQPRPIGDGNPKSGWIRACWTDGQGQHTDEAIGELTIQG